MGGVRRARVDVPAGQVRGPAPVVVGEVVASRNERFPEGAHVVATTGVQEYAVSDGKGVQLVSAGAAPLPTYLGALGMTGLTAYFGLLEIGKPQAGETVVGGTSSFG